MPSVRYAPGGLLTLFDSKTLLLKFNWLWEEKKEKRKEEKKRKIDKRRQE